MEAKVFTFSKYSIIEREIERTDTNKIKPVQTPTQHSCQLLYPGMAGQSTPVSPTWPNPKKSGPGPFDRA
jgi:hypothetical protein